MVLVTIGVEPAASQVRVIIRHLQQLQHLQQQQLQLQALELLPLQHHQRDLVLQATILVLLPTWVIGRHVPPMRKLMLTLTLVCSTLCTLKKVTSALH